MTPAGRLGTSVAAGLAVLHLGAAGTALTPVRRRLWPRLSGLSSTDHVALTFDDGPDPASTPAFLDLLARFDRRATFFVLGTYVGAHPELVRRIVGAGHELAVHGWDHRCVALKPPGLIVRELRAAVRVVEQVAGVAPRWYRPPYGVLTLDAWWAAHRVGLTTVLWSAWGRDWTRSATPESILASLDGAGQRGGRRGGTLLLHDTDRTSAPGSWRPTLAATGLLLDRWTHEGQPSGPLSEHWAVAA